MSLGKIVLALSCNSFIAIQRENLQQSMELVTSNYSNDLRNLIMYLLTNSQRAKSVNDLMPMIGECPRYDVVVNVANYERCRCEVLHGAGQLHAEVRPARDRAAEGHRVRQAVQVRHSRHEDTVQNSE